MGRPPAFILAAVLLAGCQGANPSAAVDPFLGRQRIAPPRTGWFQNGPGADPYYSGTRQATAPQRDSRTPGNRYAPPDGTFQYQGSASPPAGSWSPPPVVRPLAVKEPAASAPGDSIAIPPAARRPAALPDSSPGTAVAMASTAADDRADDPSPRTDPPANMPGPLIDIADLPEPGATKSRRRSQDPGSGGVRLVSGAQASSGSAVHHAVGESEAAGDAEPFTPHGRYDYDPQYRWLKGRLEYSRIDRRWKLRYIPIDGQTDDFGGSVVISDTSLLSGYERGDFVEVHGELGPPQSDDRGFAPEYKASRVTPLGG